MPGGRTHACVKRSYSHAEVRSPSSADRGVNRREDLKDDKQHADDRQRWAERRAALNCSDECAHPEGENDR
jgi:hypothetical protein